MDGKGVFPDKKDSIMEIFGVTKPIVGMLHLLPLPGSPRYSEGGLDQALERALVEAQTFKDNGADGLMVENAWDIPFVKPEDIGFETVAAMAVIARAVKSEVGLPVGINCLANAGIASMAIAATSGADFIRLNQWANAYVANEGFIEGQAGKILRYREQIKARSVKILADVHVKHGAHAIVADRSLAEQTRDVEFFDADILIATGQRTGDATPLEEILGIKEHTKLPVIIGSGLSADNARELMTAADGAVVGSSVKEDGVWWKPVSGKKVAELMEVVRSLRA